MAYMKIYIGADHAGFGLKGELIKFLETLNYEVEDMGAMEFDPQDDYPDFIFPVAKCVAKDPENTRGIVIGGSGQGEAIVANRIKGIRAALVYDEYSAKMSRSHNDANVISLGAKTLSDRKAKKLVKLWLKTSFSGDGRHIRRIEKIDKY
jgi:ribose 5-phosphate isomerase B